LHQVGISRQFQLNPV